MSTPGRVPRSGRGPPRSWSDNSNCRAEPYSCRYLEVIGLRTRQLLEADPRQGAAAPRIFDPGPGERGVEIVAPVQEHRARLERIAQGLGARRVGRENRGREAKFAVVHQAH